MESVVGDLFSSEALKVPAACRSRSLGLRRRPNTSTSVATMSFDSTKKEPLMPIENKVESDDELHFSARDESSLLMSSVDWDMLESEATKKKETDALMLLDDASYLSVSASMLTPGEGLRPLEPDKLNTLERCTLLPAEGLNPEYTSPDSESESKSSKAPTVKPKKLFDEGDPTTSDESERSKSPIITYKRRLPHMRSNFLQKRLKSSSTPLSKVPPPSSCSTPLAAPKPPSLLKKSPVDTDSEQDDDDSLLFELCDEIEKSVQKETISSLCEKKIDTSAPVPNFGGFSTARGTKIVVSTDAAKAAESLLGAFLEEDLKNYDPDADIF